MPAFSAKTAAARTLDHLLAARDAMRVRGSLMKTWGGSLNALTLSPMPQPGYLLRERVPAITAEAAGRMASLSLRLAQSEAARDCLRLNRRHEETRPQEGMWEIMLASGSLVDPSSRFWWSPQFRKLLGFTSVQEFPDVLESWSSHVHPDDVHGALTAFAAHVDDLSDQTPFDVCYRMRCKDGDYQWFRARGQVRRAADGTPTHALGVLFPVPASQ